VTAARANQNAESASVASTEVSCQVRASSFISLLCPSSASSDLLTIVPLLLSITE